MVAGFGKAGPALVHDVVIGKGDDLDAVGLEGFGQGGGGVEHERLRATGVGGCHGSLEVDETEVCRAKDVADITEKPAPALDTFSICGRGGAHRLVGNDISGDGEGYLGKVMGVGGGGCSGCPGLVEADAGCQLDGSEDCDQTEARPRQRRPDG